MTTVSIALSVVILLVLVIGAVLMIREKPDD